LRALYSVEQRDVSNFICEDVLAMTLYSSLGVVNLVISNLAAFAIKLKQLLADSTSLKTYDLIDVTRTLY